RTSLPIPGRTNTPFFFTSATALAAKESRNARDCLLLTSHSVASSLTSCVWVILVFAIVLLLILSFLISRFLISLEDHAHMVQFSRLGEPAPRAIERFSGPLRSSRRAP